MKPGLKKNIHRWRAASLLAVYILIAIHIAHWLIASKTLAPLEFNEVLYSIHLGVITAGLIFMTLAIVSTLIFGRFFCSWGCHILALQDLSAWILARLKIKPQPVRSRAFYFVPIVAMLYLFVWPQVVRLYQGITFPGFHIQQDENGWASFYTNDFWRNLPGPGITIFTFFVVGFLSVYLLGSRSFCRYACPYGVLFGLGDRVAPGKIVLTGDCSQCGICTAVCSSHVQVHKEVKEFGKVVDSNCLKDLDCVAACPNDAIHFGFTTPSLGKSLGKSKTHSKNYSFSLKEDVMLALLTLLFTVIFRGLYDAIPFLLSITLAIILAYFSVVLLRFFSREYVHLGSVVLRQGKRTTNKGKVFVVVSAVLLGLSMHSAFIHYNMWMGETLFNEVVVKDNTVQLSATEDAKAKLERSREYLVRVHEWGLWRPVSLERELASIYIFRQDYENAAVHLQLMLDSEPGDDEARLRLAKIYILQGESGKATSLLRAIVESEVQYGNYDSHLRSEAHLQLGHLEETNGFGTTALEQYQAALRESPSNMDAALALGILYTRAGNFPEAEKYLLHCDSVSPSNVLILSNLSAVYMQTGRSEIAVMCLQRVVQLQPENVPAHYNLGMMLLKSGQDNEAIAHLVYATELNPDHLNSHIALADYYENKGETERSGQHRDRAMQLMKHQ